MGTPDGVCGFRRDCFRSVDYIGYHSLCIGLAGLAPLPALGALLDGAS